MINNVGLNESLSGIKYIDLFAGIGAFRQAMSSFGAECVFSSEIDNACRSVYEHNYKETPSGDITKIKAADIPPFDILCAGFPCQSFSISGRNLGFDDPRGMLFFELCRIAAHHRPAIMLLENVPHLLTHDNGKTFRIVETQLRDLGYAVYYKILNASDFGVPQSRKRVYMVCTRMGTLDSFDFPHPVNNDVVLSDVLLPEQDVAKWHVTIENRHPILNRNPVSRCRHTVRVGTVNRGRMGERIYHINGHAITLTKSGGSVGAKTGLYLVGDIVRRLAPRECARISGFPESFQMHKSDTQAQMQFGNTIIVDVLQHIIKSLVEQAHLGFRSVAPIENIKSSRVKEGFIFNGEHQCATEYHNSTSPLLLEI